MVRRGGWVFVKFLHTDPVPQETAQKNEKKWEGVDVGRNLAAWGEAASRPGASGLNQAIQTTFTEGTNQLLGAGLFAGGFYVLRNSIGKFSVGAYNNIRGAVPGLDAHHVGQKAVMKRLVPGYDEMTAPAMLVPKVGHTIRGPNGILSRSTSEIDNVRDLIARDVKELRRVYPDVPNASLQELIQMNKTMYPAALAK